MLPLLSSFKGDNSIRKRGTGYIMPTKIHYINMIKVYQNYEAHKLKVSPLKFIQGNEEQPFLHLDSI